MVLNGSQGTIVALQAIATLLPLLSSVVVIFFGRRYLAGNRTGVFASGVMGVSFICTFIALNRRRSRPSTCVRVTPRKSSVSPSIVV